MVSTNRSRAAAAMAVLLVGCSANLGSSRKNNKSSSLDPAASSSFRPSGQTVNTPGAENSPVGSPTTPPGSEAELPTALTQGMFSWCLAAAKTKIVQAAKIAPLFDELCQNGTPTAFFVALVSSPYQGSGTLQVQYINPPTDSNGHVTSLFGVAEKGTLTSEAAFQKNALTQGDQAQITKSIAAGGSTPVSVTVTPVNSNSDQGWVRGWQIHAVSTDQIIPGILEITSDYTHSDDQYDLGSKSFMLVSQTVQAASNSVIKDLNTLSAAFNGDGGGYLVTLGNVDAADEGVPSVAISTVKSSIVKRLTYVYQLTQ